MINIITVSFSPLVHHNVNSFYATLISILPYNPWDYMNFNKQLQNTFDYF